ncbi:MAG: nicotinate-nucleotide adenylyltransferase [Elusimicrobiota bacterium]
MDKHKLGLYGGCFDPIHYGHLFTASYIREKMRLHKIIFIPSGIPPHKNTTFATPEQRYAMVKLAVNGNKYFSVSRIETDTKTVSYTYDTLQKLKCTYSRAKLYFIIGMDELIQIPLWKHGLELLSLCTFIIAARPGYDLKKVDKNVINKVRLIDTPLIDIESTQIRLRARKSMSLKYYIPEVVERYILTNKVYGSKK